jgi:hypothetical protein
MVFQSSQISGMVGGQMAMFANQHAFSQQVGVMAGTAPQMPMGGMQNPFPQGPSYAQTGSMDSGDMGARMAGGMGMALPGAVMGATMGAGMMGGSAGWLDPFTGIPRAFARGAGTGGMGMLGTAQSIGRAFSTGGLRAGGAMMTGGLAAGAAAAVPYYVAGKAVETVGQNIYQGAQNIAEVGGMGQQYFGSQAGQAGARGNQMGRQNIQGIASALHELVGEDTMRTMDSLKVVMDKAGRMGMLAGITDAQQFKQKFGKIVGQVQEVAKIMGSSLEQAMPMFTEMRSMGLWKTSDIMGTAMAAKVAGTAAPQMMGAMSAGAQMSHAMGGSMRAGAMMGQQSFMTMQAARQSGVFSEEDIMEFTGGVGGAEGQRVMAQRMTGIMGKFGQTSAGRLMMAGMGELSEGKFTGRIDPEKLKRFQSGEFGVQDLQRMGMKATRGREGAMSFHRQAEKLGQSLGAQGGIESMTQIVQQIADTKFGGSEEARHQLLQQMLGVGNREAELLGTLADKLPQIQDEQARKTDAIMRDTFRRLDERQNRSFEGFKDAVSHSWGEAMRPLQEFGERLATGLGEGADTAMNKLMGRVRRVPMGSQERMRLLRTGALGGTAAGAGVTNLGASYLQPGMMGNAIENMRAGGMGGLVMGAVGASGTQGGLMGALQIAGGPLTGGAIGIGMHLTQQTNARAQALLAAGVQTGTGTLDLGGGLTTTREDMVQAGRRAHRRAQGASMKRLKGNETPEKRSAMNTVRAELRKLIADPEKSKKLRQLKEDDPRGYAMELTKMLRQSDNGRSAMNALREGGGSMDDLDTLAIAQEEEGFGGGAHAADFAGIAKGLGMGLEFGTMEEIQEAQNQALDDMANLTTGKEARVGESYAMQIGGLAAAIPGVGGLTAAAGALGIDVGGILGGALAGGGEGASSSDVETVMTGANAELMQRYLKGDIDEGEMRLQVERRTKGKGGEALQRVFQNLSQDPEKKEAFKKAAGRFTAARGAEVGIEARSRIKDIARKSVTDVRGLGAESASRFKGLVERYREMEAGDVAGIGEDLSTLAQGLSREERQALSTRGGAFGRQAAALSLIGGGEAGAGLGEMSEEETQAFMTKLHRMGGIDVKRMGGEELQKLLKGGVEKGEVGRTKELMENLAKNMVTETQKGMKSFQQNMTQLQTEYMSKHTQFVQAVDKALGTDSTTDLKSIQAEIEQKKEQLRS